MSDTITLRLPEELLARLREKSRRTGLPVNRMIKQSLEAALADEPEAAWMKYAGTISGPRNLSSRKGYTRS